MEKGWLVRCIKREREKEKEKMEEERWGKVSRVNGWEKKKKEEEEEDETKVERSLNNSWRRNKRVWRNR